MNHTGQTALITGASSGIGAVYARELAKGGADLILVARREDRLEALAAELRTQGRRVDVLATDLAVPGVAAQLADRVATLGRTVDILVNNAGFGTHSAVAATDPERLTSQIQLNCVALVDLTRQFLPGMTERGRGTVVNVASTAAHQPLPHMAVYGATKAFVLSFTEALWAEAKPAGVRVIAVCPGPTGTEFFEANDVQDAAFGLMRSSEQVVATSQRGLRRGRPSVIDGALNAVVAALPRLMPRRLVIAFAGRAMRPTKRPIAVS